MIHDQNSKTGIALVLVLGQLVLLAMLAISFVYLMRLEMATARNYVDNVLAKATAESGVEYAIAQIRNIEEGLIADTDLDSAKEGISFARKVKIAGEKKTVTGIMAGTYIQNGDVYSVKVQDESGKLNLNDRDQKDRSGRGRMYDLVLSLCQLIESIADEDLAISVAEHLFVDPKTGRDSFPLGKFPNMAAVQIALRAAGLNKNQIEELQNYLTIYSWQDPNTIETGTEVMGKDLKGEALSKMVDQDIERWLEFQTRDFRLEPRSPVNVNTARLELIQVLIAPIQGVFVEEGPAESQSMQHYGWWSTGRGPEDPTKDKFGTVRLTKKITPEQAAQLAQAIYDRIHGIENDDLAPDQQDYMDEDGNPAPDGIIDPNPFETWEEFKYFLEHGMGSTDPADEGEDYNIENAAHDIFIGDGFGVSGNNDDPRPAKAGSSDWHPIRGGDDDANYQSTYMGRGYGTFESLSDRSNVIPWWNHYYARMQRDMVYANFNPNSLFNDWNPNANIYLAVDKGQLTSSTTEFCFEPTGVYSVQSLGEVYGPDGKVRSRMKIFTAVKLYEVLRQTTQAQFIDGLQNAGDLGGYFSPGGGSGWYDLPHGRLTLQSYPESLLQGKERYIRDSRYDGYLMYASLESGLMEGSLIRTEFNNLSGGYGGSSQEPLDLDRGDYPAFHRDNDNRPHSGSLTKKFDADSDPPETPGNVYPDGAYSEKGRTLAYQMENFEDGGLSGDLWFWLKPNFHLGISTRIRKFFNGPSRPGKYAIQQLPALYYLSNPGYNIEGNSGVDIYGASAPNTWIPPRSLAFGFSWQGGDPFNEEQHKKSLLEKVRLSGSVNWDYALAGNNTESSVRVSLFSHQWNFIYAGWSPSSAWLMVNGRRIASGMAGFAGGRSSSHPFFTTPSPAWALSGEWLSFGELPNGSGPPYYADATIDGVYGEVANGATVFPRDWYRWWFLLGRYTIINISGSGPRPYAYTSPPLDLHRSLGVTGGTLTLRSVSWTYYRVKNNRRQRSGIPSLLQILMGFGVDPDIEDTTLQDNWMGIVINDQDKRDPMIDHWASDVPFDPFFNPEPPPGEFRQWDPVSVDFQTPKGGWYFEDIEERMDRRFTYPGGSKFDGKDPGDASYRPGESFRYKVTFHHPPTEASLGLSNQALYESPVFDDITFTFSYARPKLLSWYAVG